MIIGHDGCHGSSGQKSLEGKRPFPSGVLERSGMGIDHEGVAQRDGHHPDQQGRHDGWIRDQDEGGALDAEDPRGPDALEEVLDRRQEGDLESQVVHQVGSGSHLFREALAAPAIRIPRDEEPWTSPAMFRAAGIADRSSFRLWRRQAHGLSARREVKGSSFRTPSPGTRISAIPLPRSGAIQPAVLR